VGLEYNITVHEVVPTLNWVITRESARIPMISLGTSSDRIGSPEGKQAYYLTFAKAVPKLRIAPYFSINYSETDRGFNLPFGVNIALDRRWSLLPMYDGNRTHLLLTYKQKNFNVSLMAVYLRHFGLSVGFGF
jgi:hypothetical protein